jgi:hypothetical protein
MWAALASAALSAATEKSGVAGAAASAPSNTNVSVGGFNVPAYPTQPMGQSVGIDLSNPQTAIIAGAGVLLLGALLLAAVKR